MQHHCAQRRIVGIWKIVDDGMDRVATSDFVFDARGFDEAGVVDRGQEGVGEIAEEGLEKASYTVDVVGEEGWVAEVDRG